MLGNKNVLKLYNLPIEVIYCKKCVMSNQRPRITFNEVGVCSACTYREMKEKTIDWNQRKKELIELCDKYRKNDGTYDVLVPCSGGKDGGTVAHRLKVEYNMHPLTVTWAPHIYTEIGWTNLQNFIKSGFDNILITPDGQLHRKLTKLAFETMGDPFQPFIFGQYSAPFRVANQYDIKLVFYGEDAEAEYGGDLSKANRASLPWEYFTKVRFSGIYPEQFEREGVKPKDLLNYSLSPLELEQIKEKEIKQYFFSYFVNWTPQENYYYCSEHTGLQANPFGRSEGTYSKYASLDDQLDGFHYYLMFLKFGIGRATSDASHELRDGHITREEAVALVHKYDGEFPKRYFQTFLEYCSITEKYFWEVADSWRGEHIWKRVNGQWVLKYRVR